MGSHRFEKMCGAAVSIIIIFVICVMGTSTWAAAHEESENRAMLRASITHIKELKENAALLESAPLYPEFSPGLMTGADEELEDCFFTPVICYETDNCDYLCLGFYGFFEMKLRKETCYTFELCTVYRDCGISCSHLWDL